jgi:hypothetical protein
MRDLLKKAAYSLLWVWQLPQNIAEQAVWMYYERKAMGKSSRQLIRGVRYLRTSSIGSGKALALGEYVVLNWFAGHDTEDHEFGHVRQSRMLGPLYLPLIGSHSATPPFTTTFAGRKSISLTPTSGRSGGLTGSEA